jgi:hypothetical protein
MTFRLHSGAFDILQLVLLLSAAPISPMSAQNLASDNFERATLGANWTRFGGSAAEIVNGHDLGAPDPANWCFVGWTASAFDTDQFSEIVTAPGKPDTMLTQVYVRQASAADVGRGACSGITRSSRTWTATTCTILTRTARWFGLSRVRITPSTVKAESRHNPRGVKWRQAARRIKARRRCKSRMRKRRITTIWQLMEPHTGNQLWGQGPRR